MTDQPGDKRLQDAIRGHLERQSEQLPELDSARLRAARLRALDAVREPIYRRRPMLLWGTAASLVLVAGMLLLNPAPTPSGQGNPALAEMSAADMDLLMSEESLDFYQDLEFYEWLAQYDGAG